MARTNISKRHCQCRRKCATKTGKRMCRETCTHADRYQVRKRIHGEQKAKWFDSYHEAEQFLAELTVGEEPASQEFREVAEDWLRTTAVDTEESTVAGYERIVRNHLLPVFEDRSVSDIDQREAQTLVNTWNAEHAPQTVRNRVNVLVPILRHGGNVMTVGKRDGGLVLPAQQSSKGDATINKRLFLEDAEELRLLVRAMPAEYRTFTTFLALVGCRPGEARELRQSDIINGQRLQISRAVKRVAKTVEPSGCRVGDTKTHQSRIVWCPPSLLDQIRDETAPRDALLFSDDGTWIDYNHYSKAFRRARKALPARLSKLRVYDLRHTAASILANRGASILVVAQQLGHSDPSVTATTYAHLFPAVTDSLMGQLDQDVGAVLG